MSLPPEKVESLREKLKRAKERRLTEMLEKLQREDEENGQRNVPTTVESKRDSNIMDRIIGSTEKALETTSAQQKIDPVITTKEVDVTMEIDQEINLPSSAMSLTSDKSVQTLVPMKIRRRKCTNCCGGLPGRGPGLGQGCDGRCSCIPDAMDELPRLFVTRHRESRLRGGGFGCDTRKTKIRRISCREETNSSLPRQSSLRKEKVSIVGDKEHRLPRRFRRDLSSPRGQLARWRKARGSYWESCLRGSRSQSSKNCVGRGSASAECVPTLYNSVSEVLPRISERHCNFRRKQNVMATVEWTSRSNKLRLRAATFPLPTLSATSKCFWKDLVDLVGDKYREYLPWETPSIAFDERRWPDSRKSLELLSILTNKTSTEWRNDCADGYTPSIDPDKSISSTSNEREYLSEGNGWERLRGGGSMLNLITEPEPQEETKNRSTMDNLNSIAIIPPYNVKETTSVTFSENTSKDECPWPRDSIGERVLRFYEDQGYCGSPEHRNEDGRIRGGCGRSYKPVQHSYFSNASTILARRDLQYPRSPCSPPARPQVSCRTVPVGRPPLSCQRSSPICSPTRFQNHVSCPRIDPYNGTSGCCACNSYGGPAYYSNVTDIICCCRTQQQREEPHPCQCKCQTSKSFRSCGGCGGQSCGRIYSCSGPGGGTCCFPRNTGRRTGPECCGGGNSNRGGCC